MPSENNSPYKQENVQPRDFLLATHWRPAPPTPQDPDQADQVESCDATSALPPGTMAKPANPATAWTRFERQRFLKVWQVAMISLGHPPLLKERARLSQESKEFSAALLAQKKILMSWMANSVQRAGYPLVIRHESDNLNTTPTNKHVDAYVGLSLLLEKTEHPPKAALEFLKSLAELPPDTKAALPSDMKIEPKQTLPRSSNLTRERQQTCRLMYALAKLHYGLDDRSIDIVAQDVAKAVSDTVGTPTYGLGEAAIKKMLREGQSLLSLTD